jgi:hypothetical protein
VLEDRVAIVGRGAAAANSADFWLANRLKNGVKTPGCHLFIRVYDDLPPDDRLLAFAEFAEVLALDAVAPLQAGHRDVEVHFGGDERAEPLDEAAGARR